MVSDGATRSLCSGYVLRLLEFRILGPLEVVGENGPLRLGGPRQRAVLAILLLNANRVVPVYQLADDLYGDAPPASALTQIQAQISHLRKLLDPERTRGASGSLIETRPPGYVIRLAPEQLDLRRFERLSSEAAEASSGGDHATASHRYRAALDLWRGPALAEFAHDSFAQPAIARLEDLRVGGIEDRIEAELAQGRQAELVGELESLVSEHPFRERTHGQLMLALYRSGRQAEALKAYRRLRRALVEELGIEPGPALQELERAILTQDPSLLRERSAPASVPPDRSILVVASSDAGLDALLTVAERLAGRPPRELILTRPVVAVGELTRAAAVTNARRRELEVPARAAAFTTSELASDVLRLTTSYDVELVLLDAPAHLDEDRLPDELAEILERSPAHVGILTAALREPGSSVVVPFGGGEHDWAALELAASLASSVGAPLRLVGTRGRPREGRRDASRLLADAAIAIQRLVDVDTEPLLVDPTEDALVEAVADAAAVVMGISPRWRRDGIGATRRALVRAGVPVLLVHRGLRPGGLAPRDTRTRFTWSLQA
jgi:DNA-binding SARP family transcriptional activator